MKKAFLAVAILLVLAIAAVSGAIWYVRPSEQLDLSYQKINAFDKVAGMVLTRQLKLELSDDELTSLVRAALSGNPELSDRMRITGARVAVEAGRIALYVNLLVGGQIKAGATLYGTLQWGAPNLRINLEEGYVRGFKLPADLFAGKTYNINLYEQLPVLVGIKEVRMEPGKLAIDLKIPR